MTKPRTRANRVGQLIFTLVTMAAIGVILFWLASLCWGHWWFWLAAVFNGTLWAVLLGTGIAAAIGSDKTPQNSRT